MLKIAYRIGVAAAMKEAAGEASAIGGLKTLGRGAWGGIKDFFTADKVRAALRNVATNPEMTKKAPGFGAELGATQAAQTVLEAKGAKGVTQALKHLAEALTRDPGSAARKQLRSAIMPYLGVAGAGGVALGGPLLAKKVFPGLRGD